MAIHHFTQQFVINKRTDAHTPVEQLQGHSVSIVVGHQIHSLVAQTQVSHQGLHYAGLLEDGVPVGSLGGSGTGENELWVSNETEHHAGNIGNMNNNKNKQKTPKTDTI